MHGNKLQIRVRFSPWCGLRRGRNRQKHLMQLNKDTTVAVNQLGMINNAKDRHHRQTISSQNLRHAQNLSNIEQGGWNSHRL